MHMTIPLKVLQAGLKVLAPATKGRSPLPVLKHVLIQDGNLTCTDLDLRIEHSLTDVERHMDHEPVGVTVDYKTLADWVSLAKSDVTLRHHDGVLFVTSGKSRTSMPCLPGVEFPEASWDDGQSFEFPDGLLQQVLRKVDFARAQAEETRAVLTGTLFEFDSNGLTLVGCDGRRLAYQTIPGQHEKASHVLAGADNILGLQGDLALTIGHGSWSVQSGPTKLGGRILQGTFPDWRKVSTFETPHVLALPRAELMEALRRVLLFAQDKQSPHLVHLDFADAVLRISAETGGTGSAADEIHTGWDGKLSIGFNGAFLLEGLARVDTPTIEWGFQDSERATRMRVGEWNHVSMPVRLREVVHA